MLALFIEAISYSSLSVVLLMLFDCISFMLLCPAPFVATTAVY